MKNLFLTFAPTISFFAHLYITIMNESDPNPPRKIIKLTRTPTKTPTPYKHSALSSLPFESKNAWSRNTQKSSIITR
jgi:hypothetical protein